MSDEPTGVDQPDNNEQGAHPESVESPTSAPEISREDVIPPPPVEAAPGVPEAQAPAAPGVPEAHAPAAPGVPEAQAPAAPGVPEAHAPAAPREDPSPASRWFAAFTKRELVSAAIHVGVAVGAALVGGLVLLLVMALAGGTVSDATRQIPIPDDLGVGIGSALTLLLTLSGLVFGGELTATVSATADVLSGSASISVWVFPLLLTVGALIAVLWWGVRAGRGHALPTRLHTVTYAAAVGLASSLVLLVLCLAGALRTSESGATVTVTSAGVRLVLFTTVLVGAAAYLGRRIGADGAPHENWWQASVRMAKRMPRWAREMSTYAVVGTAVFGVIGAILAIIGLWDSAGAGGIPVAIVGFLNVAALLTPIAHLAGVTAGGAFGGRGSSETLTLIGMGEPLAWLLVVAALLVALVVAVRIGTRRPRSTTIDWKRAWVLPVAVFGAWVVFGLVFFGVGFAAAGQAGIFGGSLAGGVGLALWTPLVFFVWAAAVEVGAQTLPTLIYGLSPNAHAFLAGRTAVQEWVAGPVSASAAPPGETDTPPAAPEPLSAPQPLSPRAKRGIIVGASVVGGLVILSVLGGVALSIVNSTRGPEALVKTYLQAIAAGHADAANAIVDPNVSNAERGFLRDEVMKTAQHIKDVKVGKSTVQGDMAYVSASYTLDGVRKDVHLTLTKGESEMLVLDTWELHDSLVQRAHVQVRGPGAPMLGGHELPVSMDGSYGSAEVVLYPGIYTISGAKSDFFELEDTPLQVGGDAGAQAEIAFSPTAALTAAVQDQVDAKLAECVKSTAAKPDGCPFNAYTWNKDTTVTWKLTTAPVVKINETGAQFTARGGVATATYSENFLGTTRERSDEDSFSMNGAIEIDGAEVKVSFSDSWW